jgi:hypothetical protein
VRMIHTRQRDHLLARGAHHGRRRDLDCHVCGTGKEKGGRGSVQGERTLTKRWVRWGRRPRSWQRRRQRQRQRLRLPAPDDSSDRRRRAHGSATAIMFLPPQRLSHGAALAGTDAHDGSAAA